MAAAVVGGASLTVGVIGVGLALLATAVRRPVSAGVSIVSTDAWPPATDDAPDGTTTPPADAPVDQPQPSDMSAVLSGDDDRGPFGGIDSVRSGATVGGVLPVRLDVGRAPDGAPVAVGAAAGLAVVGAGALTRSVYAALVAQLAADAMPGDEVRVTGWSPADVAALRLGGASSAGPDVLDGPAVATLVDDRGRVRGAVTCTRDADAPRAPSAVLAIGRTSVRLIDASGRRTVLDPVLPVDRRYAPTDQRDRVDSRSAAVTAC